MKILLTYFLTFIALQLLAQNPQQVCGHQLYHPQTSATDFHPCGTQSFKSDWLKEYQRNPAAYSHGRAPSATTYLPVSLHIVGDDDSTGYGRLNSVLAAFCQVNEDYSNTGLQFFIEFPIHYIPNSDFNDHDSVHIGGGYMLQYNVPNTSNVYFVRDPAGNCGYNLPYAGMTVSYSCLTGNTFSHELGHALSIMHPFLGWEGGQSYNAGPQTSFSGPAPKEVYYNYTYFKDTMWLDTLIVDTTEVEYVTRTGSKANCQTAADGFCDTPADYLAFRWACNSNGQSGTRQIDPDTVGFYSDGANIMSYSTCLTDFTPDQAAAMNAFVSTNRQSHLYNQNPIRDTIDINNLMTLEPADASTIAQTSNVVFRWNKVPGATHYSLKVCAAPCSTPNLTYEEVLVTDTFYVSNMTYNPRPSFLPYRWQIKPINQGNTCANISSYRTFNTAFPTAVATLQTLQTFELHPNPVASHQDIQLEATATQATTATVQIVALTGQVLRSQVWQLQTGHNTNSLSTKDLAAGVYVVYLEEGNRKLIKKLVIAD